MSTSKARAAYDRLEATFARASKLRSVLGLLDWDAAILLPQDAASSRGAQVGALLDILSETLSDPRLEDLAFAAQDADLDDWRRANLREMQRDIRMSRATPVDLATRLAAASTLCERSWRAARASNDVSRVRDDLERVVDLGAEIAAARGEALGLSPFDAMMEVHEPGARSDLLSPLFDDLALRLAPLIDAASDQAPGPSNPLGHLSPSERLKLFRAVAERLGLGPDQARIDGTAHAFFMDDNPGDTRIGVGLDGPSALANLTGLLHEIGHARYERAVPALWRDQPVGRPRSAALQESQALLLERLVGGSSAFWRGLAPFIAAETGVDTLSLKPETLVGALRRVQKTTIRVEADELTYGLHIVLRFRLERDLLEGRLRVRDLPEAWNSGFFDLFGFTPQSHVEGCLQDIHWHRALFGYFPSYAQGQWAASQFVEAAERDIPDLFDGLGRFSDLEAWLQRWVRGNASRLETHDLMQEATGAPLSSAAYFRRMRRRYVERVD